MMANCLSCNRRVDIDAAVCPNCKRPNPTTARSHEKLIAGVILLGGALSWGASKLNDKPSADQLPTAQVEAEAAPTVDQSQELPTPENEIAAVESPTQVAAVDPPIQEEPTQAASAPPVAPPAVSEPAPPKLTKYYFQVGTPEAASTVEVSAPTPEKAQQILRDFRGNPTVIQGPATAVSW